MTGKILVDYWSGDLHQKHAGSGSFDTWSEAAAAMAIAVESGMLCNVFHSDFLAPAKRIEEQAALLRKQL